MKYLSRTKQELIEEISILKKKNKKLEESDAKRKQAENELRESEEKYRILFIDSPDSYLSIIDGVFVDCNRVAEIMMRGDRKQIIGQSPEALSPEFQRDGRKSSEAAAEKINDAFRNGTNTFEWVHRRFDDTELLVEVSISSIILKGKPALFTAWRDITERKRIEVALKESEDKYRLIAENTADLISIMDMNLRLIYVSPTSVRLRGFTVEEALEQTPEQILTHESLLLSLAVFEKEMQLEASGTADPDRTLTMELEEYKKDGSTIWVEVSFSFLRDKDGKPVEILMVTRDITKRKQAEDELRESEERYRNLFENAQEAIFVIQDAKHGYRQSY
jgi:two-component system sensor histidine kinase/response regulator